jgi:hypothetical protein
MGKLRELVDATIRRRVNILSIQETNWKGQKAKEVEDTLHAVGIKRVHGGFMYGSRNQEGEDVLNFALAYDLLIVNTLFRKRESHIVTFRSGQHTSQIDFILTRREDRCACFDCKVLPRECVVPQHKLVVADFRFQVRVHRDKWTKIARMKW